MRDPDFAPPQAGYDRPQPQSIKPIPPPSSPETVGVYTLSTEGEESSTVRAIVRTVDDVTTAELQFDYPDLVAVGWTISGPNLYGEVVKRVGRLLTLEVA